MGALVEFQKKFKVNEYIIYETEYWIWSLRPHQATLGAGILSLKRECSKYGELNPEEFADLNNIIKVIEKTLSDTFNYDVINYLILMMVDKHVHYHIFPRYQKPLMFLDEVWEDSSWPAVPTLLGEPLLEDELREIASLIRSNIK